MTSPASGYPPLRPLTREEQELVEGNLGLAYQEAWRVAKIFVRSCGIKGDISAHVEQAKDDLEGWAMQGLCVAAQRWNPARGVKFGTYAFYIVKGAVRSGAWEMAISSGSRLNIYRGRSIARFFCDILPEKRHLRNHYLYYDVWDCRGNGEDEFDPEITDDLSDLFKIALNERYCRIIYLRVIADWNLQKIADLEQITKERVRQICDKAIERLKASKRFIEALEKRIWRRRQHYTADDFERGVVGTSTAFFMKGHES